MKQNCYITSLRTTHKNRINEIIGPCGPCSFINLINLNGCFELEKELSQMGRLKPFFASNFTSFLIWSNYYKINIQVYTNNLKIPNKMFEMMFKFEKIPNNKQEKLKNECLLRQKEIVEENKNKIHLFKEKPIEIIDKLLDKNYIVAFNMADFFDKDFLVSHFRVCYKKDNEIYYIKDSREGLIELNKDEMLKHLNNLKAINTPSDIIGYKE